MKLPIKIGTSRRAILKPLSEIKDGDNKVNFNEDMLQVIGKELLVTYYGEGIWRNGGYGWHFSHNWLKFTSGNIIPKEQLERYCDTEILEKKDG